MYIYLISVHNIEDIHNTGEIRFYQLLQLLLFTLLGVSPRAQAILPGMTTKAEMKCYKTLEIQELRLSQTFVENWRIWRGCW